MSEKTLSISQEASSQPKMNVISALSSFLHNLWLFTESDFATFVFPDTAFGIFGALAGPLLTTNSSPSLLEIFGRLPWVLLWNWGNLLIFDLANQRLPDSVAEDALNKPWRPLPSGRMTIVQARRLLLASLPIVLAVNYFLGDWEKTALLFSLTWMYNDLKGGDDDFIIRNLIIGFAFGLYNGGALNVACGSDHSITTSGFYWVTIISGVIFTTMHIQDMKDQAGDRSRNRRSAPLVLGDGFARWTIAVPVLVWSVVCPLFWGLGPLGYVVPVGLGICVAVRILWLRSVHADRRSWQLWTGWTGCLYFLPLAKDPSVFYNFVKAQMG